MNVSVPSSAKWKKMKVPGVTAQQLGDMGFAGIEVINDYTMTKVKRKRKEGDKASHKQTQKSKKPRMDGTNTDKNEKEQVKKQVEETSDKKGKKPRRRAKKKEKDRKKTKNGKANANEDEDLTGKDDVQEGEENYKNDDVNVEEEKNGGDKNESVLNSKEVYSRMSAWNDLFVPFELLSALDDLKFHHPMPIQAQVLPAAIKGRLDIVGAAETGSGKTLAFGIPLLTGILSDIDREKNNTDLDGDCDNDGKEDTPNQDGADVEDSSEEEEDMSDEEAETGCVKVINDVVFDFKEDPNEFIVPPLEILDEIRKDRRPNKGSGKLRGLILAPTRELAIQVKDHIEEVVRHTGIRVAVVVGGMAPQKQERLLKRRPEIVVATPGRLWDLIRQGNEHLSAIKDIRYLVIDETDRMVEKGHFEELHHLLEMLNEDNRENGKEISRQNFVFSATMSLIHEAPAHMKKKKGGKKLTVKDKLEEIMTLVGMKSRRKVVDLTGQQGIPATLTESKIDCSKEEKDFYLYYFTQMHPGRTIVFCNSIDCVRRLVKLFSFLDVTPLGLFGDMGQKQRLKSLERFRDDPRGFLIATDVAARGLDINNVEHVVHYQVPKISESYVHRCGRSARAGKEGLSVLLIDPSETQAYRKVLRTLKKQDGDLPSFPTERSMFSAVKSRVALARELDKMQLMARREASSKATLRKAAEQAELIISDSDSDDDDEASAAEKSRKVAADKVRAAAKKAELAALLATPLSAASRGFGGKYPTKTGKLELPSDLTGNSPKRAVDVVANEARSLQEMKRLQHQKRNKKQPFKKRSKRKAK